jgi:predicted alpha/beta-hydrolase family hydrolase
MIVTGQPWLASTPISMESPTARRIASTWATSSWRVAPWTRSFTVRNPISRRRSTSSALCAGGWTSPVEA